MAITKKIIIGFIAILLLAGIAVPAFAIEAEQEYPKIPLPGYEQSYSLDDIMKPADEKPEKLKGVDALGFLALYIFMLILYLAGIIAFAVLVFLGIRLITSKGQPLVRKEIRDKVIQVLWGLGLLLGAYIILNTINPELTFIHRPGVSPIEPTGFELSHEYKTPSASEEISFTANSKEDSVLIKEGEKVNLKWSSSLDSCKAASDPEDVWSGNKNPSGEETVGPISQDTTVALFCSPPPLAHQKAIMISIKKK